MSGKLSPTGVQTGMVLSGHNSSYSVLEVVGEGAFGTVVKCKNLFTKEAVAVKILKQHKDFPVYTKKELSMLEAISVLNPDRANVVKFLEAFQDMGTTCLAFEMLDKSLFDLMEDSDFQRLSLQAIRPIAKQLFVALDALKGLGIIHTDIKPDNVMCVCVKNQPIRVKLIDFGEAIHASKAEVGIEIQPCGYMAPEVSLGLPFNEAIDMWGVGCVLAFLYLADHLFQINSEYRMMESMVRLLGQPKDNILNAGVFAQAFFCKENVTTYSAWRLMMPEEYSLVNKMNPIEPEERPHFPPSLDALPEMYPVTDLAEYKDRTIFAHLLKWVLHWDADKRISPLKALQHPYISMVFLDRNPHGKDYLTTAQTMMAHCQLEDSADTVNTSAASEPEQEPGTDDSLANTTQEDDSEAVSEAVSEVESPTPGPSAASEPAQEPGTDDSLANTTQEVSSEAVSEAVSEVESPTPGPSAASEPAQEPGSVDSLANTTKEDDSEAVSEVDSPTPGPSEKPQAIHLSEDKQVLMSSKELPPVRDFSIAVDQGDPSACSTDGELFPASGAEDVDSSSDRAESMVSPAASSASCGRRKKILKRLRKFFRRLKDTFSCCCRTED